ncbi:MAG: hypothetical protein M1366_02475 [Patescibacteria group bacterium]|nr:hypothetical protein [Patescibacteria group bacterium]
MIQDNSEEKKEVGYVVGAQDYLVYLEGLPSARINDIVISQKGGRAIVTALEREKIEVQMLDSEKPTPGDSFQLTGKGLTLPLKANLLGRAIDPLGVPIDGKGKLPPIKNVEIDLDIVAPGIDAREVILDQFTTGLLVIDTLLPIGKGQRELLFGEPRSGKTSLLLDIILSQKDTGRICVYNAIGKSEVDILRFLSALEKFEAMGYTTVVAADSNMSAPIINISPAVSLSLAEYYRDQGRDVLLILDDLSTHAKYLREASLLAGRIPGRESYPADIFYQHSHLVERAGYFNDKYHKGSITLLPMIETNIENLTSVIPTSVMSMTDGHILFSSALRAQGKYPAIEVDKSVTRVGRQTQKLIHKKISDRIRSLLSHYHEVERLSRFGSELTAETQLVLKRGVITEGLIRQEPLKPIPVQIQILLLTLVFATFFDNKDLDFLKKYKQKIIDTLSQEKTYKDIAAQLDKLKYKELVELLQKNLQPLENACREDETSQTTTATITTVAQKPPQETNGTALNNKQPLPINNTTSIPKQTQQTNGTTSTGNQIQQTSGPNMTNVQARPATILK